MLEESRQHTDRLILGKHGNVSIARQRSRNCLGPRALCAATGHDYWRVMRSRKIGQHRCPLSWNPSLHQRTRPRMKHNRKLVWHHPVLGEPLARRVPITFGRRKEERSALRRNVLWPRQFGASPLRRATHRTHRAEDRVFVMTGSGQQLGQSRAAWLEVEPDAARHARQSEEC
jgi:hypothetical protein